MRRGESANSEHRARIISYIGVFDGTPASFACFDMYCTRQDTRCAGLDNERGIASAKERAIRGGGPVADTVMLNRECTTEQDKDQESQLRVVAPGIPGKGKVDIFMTDAVLEPAEYARRRRRTL